MNTPQEKLNNQALHKMGALLEAPGFAFFGLGILFFGTLIFISLAFIPPSFGALGQFAKDFQIWCLGYRPEKGSWEIGYFFMFLAGPIVLGLTFFLVWKEPILLTLRKSPLKALFPILSALMVMLISLGGLVGIYTFQQTKGTSRLSNKLPFPAKELRTAIPAHPFTLTNQDGQKISLKDFKNKVIMLTAVYSTCGNT
ncbi:MAG: hypothetical protein D6785_10260 [Planctomycetota bacterium]|nr:MAG: hypothetical protein D6785_10260 [Planctomycetota bacterium]